MHIEDGALVIDVRSEEEFQEGYLPGAVNVAHHDTDALIELIGPDSDRVVVLYCGSGRRAENAKLALEAAGYSEVHNASGLDALLATQPDQDGNP
jgi:phage shock protein E